MWAAEHSVETSAAPEAIWRLWADVPISGPQADSVGPELGPQISGDFPEVLAALAARAEGD
jgi:hypothetical protein